MKDNNIDHIFRSELDVEVKHSNAEQQWGIVHSRIKNSRNKRKKYYIWGLFIILIVSLFLFNIWTKSQDKIFNNVKLDNSISQVTEVSPEVKTQNNDLSSLTLKSPIVIEKEIVVDKSTKTSTNKLLSNTVDEKSIITALVTNKNSIETAKENITRVGNNRSLTEGIDSNRNMKANGQKKIVVVDVGISSSSEVTSTLYPHTMDLLLPDVLSVGDRIKIDNNAYENIAFLEYKKFDTVKTFLQDNHRLKALEKPMEYLRIDNHRRINRFVVKLGIYKSVFNKLEFIDSTVNIVPSYSIAYRFSKNWSVTVGYIEKTINRTVVNHFSSYNITEVAIYGYDVHDFVNIGYNEKSFLAGLEYNIFRYKRISLWGDGRFSFNKRSNQRNTYHFDNPYLPLDHIVDLPDSKYRLDNLVLGGNFDFRWSKYGILYLDYGYKIPFNNSLIDWSEFNNIEVGIGFQF